MTREEYGYRLSQIYKISLERGNISDMLHIVATAKSDGVSLYSDKSCITSTVTTEDLFPLKNETEAVNENKFPTPFDEEKVPSSKRAFEKVLPKLSAMIPKGTPEKKEIPKEVKYDKNHKWSNRDLGAIGSVMAKPDNHSFRTFAYVKSMLSKDLTDVAIRGKLFRLGIKIKSGRLYWKNS